MRKKNRKIIFLKNWGTWKEGDVMMDPSDVTIKELCFKHKFGRLVGDPDFATRIERQSLTMRKLAEDISFGLQEKEKSVKDKTKDDSALTGIIEDLDRKLATPTPPKQRKRKPGSRKEKKKKK